MLSEGSIEEDEIGLYLIIGAHICLLPLDFSFVHTC